MKSADTVPLNRWKSAALWLTYFVHTGLCFIFLPWMKRLLLKASWEDLWQDIRRWAVASNHRFGVAVDLQNPDGIPLHQLQYIAVANHRSWFDQLVLVEAYPRPIHFLAKKGYCDMPLFGPTITEIAEAVPVENKRLQDATERRLVEYLGRKDPVLFYVEGTRGQGKTLLPFHSGAFRYAALSGVPILPLYIYGTEQILSKHHSMLTVLGGPVVIRVGSPRSFSQDRLAEELAEFEASYRAQHDLWYDQFNADPGCRLDELVNV